MAPSASPLSPEAFVPTKHDPKQKSFFFRGYDRGGNSRPVKNYNEL